MNITSRLTNELRKKAYRDGYVASQISINIPFQIRALRASHKFSQAELAKKAGMWQPRISEIETPGTRRLNIETLLRLASAFDVALEVHFVSFSDLIKRREAFDPDRFTVNTFEQDLSAAEAIAMQPPTVLVQSHQVNLGLLDVLRRVTPRQHGEPELRTMPRLSRALETTYMSATQ